MRNSRFLGKGSNARSVTKTQIFDICCHVAFFDLRFRQILRIHVAWFNDLFNTRPNMAKRRLQKFVEREVQSSLMRRLCTHWFMFIFANLIVLLFWTRFLDTPTEPWAETFTVTWLRVVPFIVVSIALAPVFIWDAIKFSNRFTGPIVRVRRELALIADGHVPKAIEFRNGDFWKSLANDFNRAFVKLLASNTSSDSEKP